MSLTAFLVVLLAAMAHGQALQKEIRLAPGYSDLTDCQQYCIAGRLVRDITDDVASWVQDGLVRCSTKTCICAPESQMGTERFILNCQKDYVFCSGSTAEQNGAVRWVAGYCDWSTIMTPTLSVSRTITTSLSASPTSSAQGISTAANSASTIATTSSTRPPSSTRGISTTDNSSGTIATASPTGSPSFTTSSSTPGQPTQTTSTPTGKNDPNQWIPIVIPIVAAVVGVILTAVANIITRKYFPETTAVQTNN